MDLGLRGRTALVFGGSKGLGRAIAAALIAEGVKVAIVARDAERTNAAAKEIGALALPGDLSRPGQGAELVRAASHLLGSSPDILVTNPGVRQTPDNFRTLERAGWDAWMEAHFFSALELIRAVVPGMAPSSVAQAA